jgi:hypothetical protein
MEHMERSREPAVHTRHSEAVAVHTEHSEEAVVHRGHSKEAAVHTGHLGEPEEDTDTGPRPVPVHRVAGAAATDSHRAADPAAGKAPARGLVRGVVQADIGMARLDSVIPVEGSFPEGPPAEEGHRNPAGAVDRSRAAVNS